MNQRLQFSFVVLLLVCIASGSIFAQTTIPVDDSNIWTEYISNPLFGGPTNGVDRAYYPVVIKVGTTYHVWYGDGTNTRHTTSTSPNFSGATFPAPVITGMTENGYHPRVLHNVAGWDVGGTHYAGPFLMYYTNIAWSKVFVAHSVDGQAWTEIGLCTGVHAYGGNSTVYTFAVLYEGGTTWKAYTDNGFGDVQYYTSTDGLNWTGVATDILGSPLQSWETSHNFSGEQVFKVDNYYVMFYGSGNRNSADNNGAIGMAVSTNGQTWVKSNSNPIFSITGAPAWRDDRTYTAYVFQDDSDWKMYFTGRSTVGGNYSIGYATNGGLFQFIEDAMVVAGSSDIVDVAAGTYNISTAINLNKPNLTLQGAGSSLTIIQVSGTGDRFSVTASGVTIQNMQIQKTDKTGTQNIIYVAANNFTLKNNIIWGQFVIEDLDVSRAMVIAGGLTGLLIDGNTIYALRQPAYLSGPTTGNITNNFVYGTKGWVLEGGDVTFSGNTWGEGLQSNVYDIAILSIAPPTAYTDIVAMSNANNEAVIEDQRVVPAVLSCAYVDAATSYSSDLGGRYHPYQTITPAITRVVAGGKIKVAAGTYNEDVIIPKSLTLLSVNGQASTIVNGQTTGWGGGALRLNSSNVTVGGVGKGFTFNGKSGGASVISFACYVSGARDNIWIEENKFVAAPKDPGSNETYALLTDGGQTNQTYKNNIFDGMSTPRFLVYINGFADVGVASTNIDFIGNTFTTLAGGLTLSSSGGEVTGNYFQGTAGIGLNTSSSNAISGNFFQGIGSHLSNHTSSGVDVGAFISANTFDRKVVIRNGGAYRVETFPWGTFIIVRGNIQGSIDAASAGDSVIVDAGTYPENLVVNKSLSLRGANYGISAGYTPGSRVAESVIVGQAVVTANGVSFDGLQFDSPLTSGTKLVQPSIPGLTILFQNNVFDMKNQISAAIYNDGMSSTNFTILNNKFKNQFYTGTYSARVVYAKNTFCTITGNDFSAVELGVYLVGNTTDATIVSGNRFSVTSAAVLIGERRNIQIFNNDFVSGGAIYCDKTSNLTISNNSFGIGVSYAAYFEPTIGSGIVMNDNSILSAYTSGTYTGKTLFNFSTTQTINATCNWYGTAVPAEIVNKISGNVDFIPFLTSTSGPCDGMGPVVDITNDPDRSYMTIKDAINAPTTLNGDVITVAAGTYTEGPQVVVNKNLTIIGADKLTTIITPSSNTGNSGDARGWFLVNAGITLNLSNVTLDGTGRLVFMGILNKGNGTIDNCKFMNIKYNESGPDYAGISMSVRETPNINVNVTNCEFSGIGRIGVHYRGPGITGTYSGNTYTGKGAGNWLDYGVEAGGAPLPEGGARVIISNNTITNCKGVASVDGSTSAGILVTTYFGPGTRTTITGCFLNDNTDGIAVGYDALDASVVVASNNNLAGNTNLAVKSTAPLVDASANWFGSNSASVVASKVSANVDYTPWFNSGTDTQLGTPGFQGDFSFLNVDDNSPQSGLVGRIQEGINLVSGSTVNVAAGTYTENVDINKKVILQGAGSGSDPASNTIITNSANGRVVLLTASGTSMVSPVLLQNFRIVPVGINGLEVTNATTVSYVKIENVFVVGPLLRTVENEIGFKIATNGSLMHLVMNNCSFQYCDYGWYFAKHGDWGPGGSNAVDLTVTNTTFLNNDYKGIYVEKLSDATFTDVVISNNGSSSFWNDTWNGGADINLKGQELYQNLVFNNLTVTNNGLGFKEGAGMMIKARDDGATYGLYPATLTNVTISGGTFTGNERGIRFGEPGKGNITPTNVTIHNATISGNNKTYSGTDGSTYGGVVNQTTAMTDAMRNWWGSTTGPADSKSLPNVPNYNNLTGLGDSVSKYVDYNPWYLDAPMTTLSIYNLVVNVSNGSVDVNPPAGPYNHGTIVILTPTAFEGYNFVNWTGNVPTGHETDNPLAVVMNQDRTITANFAINTYTLIVDATNGTIDVNPPTGPYNHGATVTLSPMPATGYRFTYWSGTVATGHEGDNPLILTMDSDKNITAHFALKTYLLIITATNGTVSKTPNQAAYDSNAAVILTPHTDIAYNFFNWTGNVPLGHETDNPLTLVMDGDKNITANFAIKTYTIASSMTGNGTITPSGDVNVNYGANQSFTISANPGHHLDSVIVDGVRVDSTTSYTFVNVTENHSIKAYIGVNPTIPTFVISASTGSNGSIFPSGNITVDEGENQSFTITPDPHYHIDSLYIDGLLVAATGSYSFTNVQANHTIRAIFSIDTYTLSINVNGSGSVTKDPDLSEYGYGSLVQLTAIPQDLSWKFSTWSGDAGGSINPLSVTMDGDKNIGASFIPDSLYLISYRSFTAESLALERDNKNIINKFVQRKPDKVKFECIIPNHTGKELTDLHIHFRYGIITNDTNYTFSIHPVPSKITYTKENTIVSINFAGGIPDHDTIVIHGWGNKGRLMSGMYAMHAFAEGGHFATNFTMNEVRYPMPNRLNALFDAFRLGGFRNNAGLLVGIMHNDAPRRYGWLLTSKYADVLKTLYNKRFGIHTGDPRGFDLYTSSDRAIKGRQKSIPPTKQNNKLLADLVALKVNIAVSQLEITPLGFRELIYNDGTSNVLNDKSIIQIESYGDSLMMGFYDGGTHKFADSSVFNNLDRTVRKINSAFEGALDTVSFATSLKFKGVRTLMDVSYLKPNPSAIPMRIIPDGNDTPELPQVFTLYQNYPNPFNPTTIISFDLPVSASVTLKIYNILGQEVITIFDHEVLDGGYQEVEFQADDIPSGVYFYKITAEGLSDEDNIPSGESFIMVKKMMLLK